MPDSALELIRDELSDRYFCILQIIEGISRVVQKEIAKRVIRIDLILTIGD